MPSAICHTHTAPPLMMTGMPSGSAPAATARTGAPGPVSGQDAGRRAPVQVQAVTCEQGQGDRAEIIRDRSSVRGSCRILLSVRGRDVSAAVSVLCSGSVAAGMPGKSVM